MHDYLLLLVSYADQRLELARTSATLGLRGGHVECNRLDVDHVVLVMAMVIRVRRSRHHDGVTHPTRSMYQDLLLLILLMSVGRGILHSRRQIDLRVGSLHCIGLFP